MVFVMKMSLLGMKEVLDVDTPGNLTLGMRVSKTEDNISTVFRRKMGWKINAEDKVKLPFSLWT